MKKLNLGIELSKNEQKKVLGGATLKCTASWSQVVYNFSSCSNAASYCAGAQGSSVDYCY